MNEKKQVYQSTSMALPPLKMVLGELPEPDPNSGTHPFRPFGMDKSEYEAKGTLNKIIGRLQASDK